MKGSSEYGRFGGRANGKGWSERREVKYLYVGSQVIDTKEKTGRGRDRTSGRVQSEYG